MPALKKRSALRRTFAMMSLALAACTQWAPQQLTPAQVVSEEKPYRIRVTRSDSTRVVLVHPQVAGDSMIGSAPEGLVSIPLSDVAAVSLQKGNAGETVLVVLALFAAVVAVISVKLAENSGN